MTSTNYRPPASHQANSNPLRGHYSLNNRCTNRPGMTTPSNRPPLCCNCRRIPAPDSLELANAVRLSSADASRSTRPGNRARLVLFDEHGWSRRPWTWTHGTHPLPSGYQVVAANPEHAVRSHNPDVGMCRSSPRWKTSSNQPNRGSSTRSLSRSIRSRQDNRNR